MKSYIDGMKITFASTLMLTSIYVFSVEKQVDNIPTGWNKSGGNAEEFIVQVDKDESYSGNNSMSIFSIDQSADHNGLVSVTQFSSAEEYRGKRLKVSIHLKGYIDRGHFGVWFQTYDNKQNILDRRYTSFTEASAIKEWTASSVVVDIKDNVASILYGVYVNGRGQYWIDNVNVQSVSDETALAGIIQKESAQ